MGYRLPTPTDPVGYFIQNFAQLHHIQAVNLMLQQRYARREGFVSGKQGRAGMQLTLAIAVGFLLRISVDTEFAQILWLHGYMPYS